MDSTADILGCLSKSKFRSSFKLGSAEITYALSKGRPTIERHAYELLQSRVGAAYPRNDGKQTPYRNHPVFIAQHATATCCRGCIEKWHHIPRGRPLTDDEISRLVGLIMAWLDNQLNGRNDNG